MESVRWWDRAPLEVLVGSEVYPRTLSQFAFVYCAGLSVVTIAVLLLPGAGTGGANRVWVITCGLIAIPISGLMALAARGGRLWWWDILAVVGPSLTGTAAVLLGPSRQEGIGIIVAFAAGVFLFVRPRTAILCGVAMVVTYGVAMAFAEGFGAPAVRAAMLGAAIVPVAAIQMVTLRRLELLASAERRSAMTMAAANATLQRFVSAPVANAILASDVDVVLAPHRRQVAVVFADLRGFTRFSLGAEPEDVVEVLGEFYAAFGGAAKEIDATLGAFVGDGVMAYVGDPIVVDDPVARAAALGRGLAERMAPIKAAWRARGYQLGHGVGIAYGYATLGIVGFEGRNDYTALGSVVNLASRLCGEAADGELVFDARANAELGRPTTPRRVELKGYAEPVEVFVL